MRKAFGDHVQPFVDDAKAHLGIPVSIQRRVSSLREPRLELIEELRVGCQLRLNARD